jgi:undecaprenol kinase
MRFTYLGASFHRQRHLPVLVMELLNTAVETTVDLVTREFHPLACIAKNVGAAAVLLAALYALLVGVVIIGRRFVNFF